ncbi:MAG: AmmeMemoRadiSam system radical SAM enzyme [Deltaproteobacteria bacterium]|nr:AmmeMemoRadiSam system radical SAM enzyme [Deltaproteobacteria bacterium]
MAITLEDDPRRQKDEALFYEPLEENKVRCRLCGHECKIKPGRKGICGVRSNQGGMLVSLVYQRPVAEHIDPIEKKPLYHFLPGTLAYSLGTAGCNFACVHCQNADISQADPTARYLQGRERTPLEIVQAAEDTGCYTVAHTYTEPTIFYEYSFDIARLAHERGLKNAWVTNGYVMEKPARAIAPYLDAANVDLKAFSERVYMDLCRARLSKVMDTIVLFKKLGIWVEVTTLLIPDMNDDDKQLKGIAGFLAGVGPEIPWHVTRFYPTYKLTDRPPTPEKTLSRAWEIGKEAGLRYVYEGNVPGKGHENTSCYQCGETLITRRGFSLVKNLVSKEGRCPKCNAPIDGVWTRDQTD